MAGARVSVVVADDHPLFRDGIARAMRERPDLELVAEAGNGREALEQIRELRPAVAVLDLSLPELDGLEVLNAIRRDELPTRTLILSASTEGELVHQAVASGASGYLSKSATRADVCDAVAAIARGEMVLDPALQSALLAQVRARGVDDTRPVLTAREREILGLMADGLSAPAIGERLFLSPATVKTHMGHMYEKLGVSDRAACVAEAMRRGLLE
jgi:two-component system, NarL family, nitrate/nitrite response regulator NarL